MTVITPELPAAAGPVEADLTPLGARWYRPRGRSPAAVYSAAPESASFTKALGSRRTIVAFLRVSMMPRSCSS